MAVTYRPVHCCICGKQINIGRKYVAPGLYPYRLEGYGEYDKAHHACAIKQLARACAVKTGPDDLSDLLGGG